MHSGCVRSRNGRAHSPEPSAALRFSPLRGLARRTDGVSTGCPGSRQRVATAGSLPADPTPSSTTPFRITLFVNLGSGLRRAVRTWMRASQARVERGERIRFFWTIGLTRPVRKFLSPMSPHPATKADFLAYGQRSHHSERLWLETPAGAGMGEADRGGGAGVLRPLRRLHSSRRSVRPRSFIRS